MTIDEAFVMFAAGFGVGCISIIVLIGLVGCPMTAPIEAWAIKAPEGILYPNSCERYKSECIERFTDGEPYAWGQYEERGYRCVKVQITEAQE